MLFKPFYTSTKNNKTIFFCFAENANLIPKEINSKSVCLVFTKKQGNCSANFGYNAVYSAIPDIIDFWIKKNIDFIINPFDAKQRGFDERCFSLLTQNNITPVILLEKILTPNKEEQIHILQNLFVLNELCKKYKLPLLILSEKNEFEVNGMSNILGYNKNQISTFIKGLFL